MDENLVCQKWTILNRKSTQTNVASEEDRRQKHVFIFSLFK